MEKTQRITRGAILASLAIILGWVERQIPLFSAMPGMKIGISNLAVLLALYGVSPQKNRDALYIVVIKTLVTGLLFSGLTGFLYAFSGGVFSWGVMCLLKKTDRFSIYGVSVAGAAAHCMGQLLCAVCLLRSISILSYGSFMLVCAVFAGTLLAAAAAAVGKNLLKTF